MSSATAQRIATNYDEVICYRPPPPPYEKVAAASSSSSSSSSGMLSKVFSVWRRQAIAEQQGKLGEQQGMMVDKKQVENAVTLINIATEMEHSGNQQMALDLYMMGLDRMLSAFPLENNPNMKRALESKIMEISYERNLDLRALEGATDAKEGAAGRRSLNELFVNTLVLGAVVLKKSPVPDLFAYAMGCARAGLERVDGARKFTWGIASHGIAKAAQLDRHFEIHQTVDGLYQSVYGALSKAGAAYAETPGFGQAK